MGILIILQIIIISFHPILFNLMLILIRLIISFFVLKINSSWFFFLLMLVFLGGVIILIIYINTLIINEKIFFKKIFPFVFKKNIFSKINSSNFFPIMVYENINIFLITFL